MPDRVSIRDLARIAGVSRTTVSLALRGSHEVSGATRKRIQKLAKQHDYRSHPAVSALMQQVGRGVRVHDEEVLAFIRSGDSPEELAPGPLEMLQGAREEGHRLGYRIDVFWAGFKGADSERLGRILHHRGIRGVIWGTMPYPHAPIVFPWKLFASIACTQSADVPRLPCVGIHHAKGMSLVIEEMNRRGAKRIGFLGHCLEDARQDFGWGLGVDLYRRRGGRAFVTTLMLEMPFRESEIRAWIKHERIDAIISTQELFGQSRYLEGKLPRASLDVPTADLGRVGGLYQNAIQIGRHAVRSLAVRLSNGILGLPEYPFSVVTQATFVDGDSLSRATISRRKPAKKA